jgi:hypothetical protein
MLRSQRSIEVENPLLQRELALYVEGVDLAPSGEFYGPPVHSAWLVRGACAKRAVLMDATKNSNYH